MQTLLRRTTKYTLARAVVFMLGLKVFACPERWRLRFEDLLRFWGCGVAQFPIEGVLIGFLSELLRVVGWRFQGLWFKTTPIQRQLPSSVKLERLAQDLLFLSWRRIFQPFQAADSH